jgi:hypothetical protein
MISQAAGLLTLTVYVSLFGACTRVSQPVTAESDGPAAAATMASEQAIKTSGQSLLAEGTDTLKIERQTEYELGGNGPFLYPVSLATDDSGVYISDNNAHAIRFRAPHSESVTTLPTLDTAKLVWPNTIQISKGSAFVSDNEGIKSFGLDGRFQRVLKTYYAINDFTIGTNRKIYVNPSFRTHKASNPLIIQVDSEGARVKGFGERLNHSNYGYLDDLAYLCTAGDSILAVFKHRPVVYVYNSEGKFLREFPVKHPAFESLAALAGDVAFTHPGPNRYRLPTYVSGARVVGNRLMVLLDLPQPEIVEMSLMGKELGRYTGKVPFTTSGYRGFDVQLSGSTYRFWLLAVNLKKLAFMEFTGARKNHDSQARTYSN